MGPWELGGAHNQAGRVAARGVDAAPMRLKLPKARPVMIQSTASEVMAILVPLFMVFPPGFCGSDLAGVAVVAARHTHHGLKLQSLA
jgi:hypothetical protein